MAIDAIIIAIGALITAAGSLVGALALGAKQLAEARATRVAAETAARQVTPNHGSSLADALKRVEGRQVEQAKDLAGIRDDARADREALTALQRSADTSHAIIDARIDTLKTQLDHISFKE